MTHLNIDDARYFLKDSIRKEINFLETDQSKGIEVPPLQKPYDKSKRRIDLPSPSDINGDKKLDVFSAIRNRESRRDFSEKQLTLEELSFLLWSTQGIRKKINPRVALRTVPSAGNRHAIETYLCVLNVKGLDRGIYRFLPLEHQLIQEREVQELEMKIVDATFMQQFCGKCAVDFIWTAIPYRMEWRYDAAAGKVILLDAGHVCQNLYLACEAINAGCCAVAAYDQDLMDELIGVDGKDEFVIYLGAVGKLP